MTAVDELLKLQFDPRGLVQSTVRVESRDLQHILTETGKALTHLQERYTVLEENQKVLEENQKLLLAENQRLREQLDKTTAQAAGSSDLLMQLFELTAADVEATVGLPSHQRVALLHRSPAFMFLIKRFNNMVDNFNLLNTKLSQVEASLPNGASATHEAARPIDPVSAEEDARRHGSGDSLALEDPARSRRPYLGMEISENPDLEGLRVVSIKADGPAARAGLVTGDILVAFNDVELTTREAFRAMVRTTAPGQVVPFIFVRVANGKPIRMKSTVVVGAQDPDAERAMLQHDERMRLAAAGYAYPAAGPASHHRLQY